MSIRRGEPGVVNRQAYIDGVTNDIHQLNSDIRFYESEYADREMLVKEYKSLRQYKRAYLMWRDKLCYKRRINNAKKTKKRLCKISTMAMKWL